MRKDKGHMTTAVRRLGGILTLALLASACVPADGRDRPRHTFFIGIDVSGSFYDTGQYDDALDFTARYIYAHMNGLGGLEVPRALFVGSIGGQRPDQAQGFHPIHDFQDKSVEQIRRDLGTWFPPDDQLTDFNAFFQRAANLAKRRNLVLTPISLLVLSDGLPDVGAGLQPADSLAGLYAQINLDPLEYLARNVTVRMLYPDPPVAVRWQQDVPHSRVRMWTVDRVVMAGWRDQLVSDANMSAQADLLNWIKDNVDFRVRGGLL